MKVLKKANEKLEQEQEQFPVCISANMLHLFCSPHGRLPLKHDWSMPFRLQTETRMLPMLKSCLLAYRFCNYMQTDVKLSQQNYFCFQQISMELQIQFSLRLF